MDEIQQILQEVKRLKREGSDESVLKARDLLVRAEILANRKAKNIRRHTGIVQANRRYQRREEE